MPIHERLIISDLQLVVITRQLGEEKGQAVLGKLRVLEKKMGLVLTLVWSRSCTLLNPYRLI